MVIGSSFGMILANKYGRKKSLFLCSLLLILTPGLLSFITNFWLVCVVRIIMGCAIGLGSCIGPIYVTETSDEKYKGRIGSLYQFQLCFGLVCAYLVNYLCAKGVYDEYAKFSMWQWSVQYLLGVIIGVGLLITLIFTKESEEWLSKKDKEDVKAKNEAAPAHSIPFLKRMGWYLFGLVFGAVKQLCGINAVMYYGPSILNRVGVSDPLIATLVFIGGWNLLSVLVIMPFVDRFKRKTIMFLSYSLLTIASFIIAIGFLSSSTFLVIAGIILFLSVFECGPGCLFWIIASEVFPKDLRDMGSSITISADNTANIVVTFLFPVLEQVIGSAACFFMFCFVSAFGSGFVYFGLPETNNVVTIHKTRKPKKGREVEEILLSNDI